MSKHITVMSTSHKHSRTSTSSHRQTSPPQLAIQSIYFPNFEVAAHFYKAYHAHTILHSKNIYREFFDDRWLNFCMWFFEQCPWVVLLTQHCHFYSFLIRTFYSNLDDLSHTFVKGVDITVSQEFLSIVFNVHLVTDDSKIPFTEVLWEMIIFYLTYNNNFIPQNNYSITYLKSLNLRLAHNVITYILLPC